MDFVDVEPVMPADAETSVGRSTSSTDDIPVATILDLLQGEGSDRTDAALARLPAEHLQRIATAAQRKSQDCLDLTRCLVDCTAELLMRLPPTDACDRVLHLNLHLASLLDDHQRWVDLRENADDYRRQPDVAARVATAWRASLA
jgi:hypothetical protein